ncbi:MAG: GNAT family N-acetyltransferase [Fusobacteriaceae bacterium]
MYKIEKMEWDSEHFQKKIGNFELINSDFEKINLEDYDVLISKIDVSEKSKIISLEKLGFNLMDTLITFSLKKIYFQEDNKYILEAKRQDLDSVVNIARTAYRLGHFHANDVLDKKKSDELYVNWIKNRFDQGEKLYIFKENELVKGFLLAKERKNEAIIDLIAVDENFKGEKIGTKMIQFFFNKNIGKKSLVGTQISNSGAIKLYENMGYRIEKFIHIFHKNY